MNSGIESIAPIATGITSILGVIGLIVYVILFVINKSGSKSYLPEVIEALKKNGITPEEASKLSDEKLKILLKSHTQLSEELITKGIDRESKRNSNFLIISIIICFALTVFFGIVWYKHSLIPQFTKYSAIVENENLIPIANANILFRDQLGNNKTDTDSKGLFTVSVNDKIIKFIINKPDFDTTWYTKNFESSPNLMDTIILHSTKNFVIKKISGTIINDITNSPVGGALIKIDGDTNKTYSEKSTGYFEILHTFYRKDKVPPIIRVFKKTENLTANLYIDTSFSNLTINIKKE